MKQHFDHNDFYPSYEGQSGTRLQVGDFTLQVWHDACAEKPWEAMDVITPTLFCGLGRNLPEETDKLADVMDFFAHVTADWCSRNWRKLCDTLSMSHDDHEEAVALLVKDWHYGRPEAREEDFREALSKLIDDTRSGYSAAPILDILEGLYTLAGVPNLRTTRHGYSQGDQIDLLLVETPGFKSACGFPKNRSKDDAQKSMETDADLIAAWAFGDCWGWVIEGKDGEDVEACFGYYGRLWGDFESAGGGLFVDANAVLDFLLDASADADAREIEAERPDLYIS